MRCLVTEEITRVGEHMAGRNRLEGLAVAHGLLILAEEEQRLHQRATDEGDSGERVADM